MSISNPTNQNIASTLGESHISEYNLARHRVETLLRDPENLNSFNCVAYSRLSPKGARKRWLSVCTRTSAPTAGAPCDIEWVEMPDDCQRLTLARYSWGQGNKRPRIREDRFEDGEYVHAEEDHEFSGHFGSQTEQSASVPGSFCKSNPTNATSFRGDMPNSGHPMEQVSDDDALSGDEEVSSDEDDDSFSIWRGLLEASRTYVEDKRVVVVLPHMSVAFSEQRDDRTLTVSPRCTVIEPSESGATYRHCDPSDARPSPENSKLTVYHYDWDETETAVPLLSERWLAMNGFSTDVGSTSFHLGDE